MKEETLFCLLQKKVCFRLVTCAGTMTLPVHPSVPKTDTQKTNK